jgi:uncharacterized Zn-binding protein involved in type VI secretion
LGKPAARIGDTTAHGGAIVAGAPTVLIGGLPAARQGDMHTCPLVNPGVPPPPHVGGPANLGSPMVLICGMMAARMGDMVTCSGPPDSIVAGCPTVLIGEGGAGGGGGAGPAGAAASAALAGGDPDSNEDHFLDVKFTDKKGNPIKGVKYHLKRPDGKKIEGTLGGKLRKSGVPQGNYEIQLKGIAKPKVSSSKVKVGGKVKVRAATFGIESGSQGMISVFEKDSNSADRLVDVIMTKVDNDKVEVEWEFKVDDKLVASQDAKRKRGGYSSPEYFFVASVENCSARSDSTRYHDEIELKLRDEEDKPVKNAGYKIFLPNGDIRKGKLDSDGYAKEENIPPGKVEVVFDDAPYGVQEGKKK